MRVLMLEAPQWLLDERRRLGQDVRDEVWDGVVHMVPLPNDAHQEFAVRFLVLRHRLSTVLTPRKPGCGRGIGWRA
jgi:hypothetical protein